MKPCHRKASGPRVVVSWAHALVLVVTWAATMPARAADVPSNASSTPSVSSTKTVKSDSALPKRDLTVEFRQVEEGAESGAKSYSAGSSTGAQTWEPQMVQVRNGAKARLQISQSLPMLWVESVSTQNTTLAGSSATTSGAAVKQSIQWFDAGQSLAVTPRWRGGRSPAQLDIEVQRSSAEPQTHGNLANQVRDTVSTSVTVPLAEWVTIAATGRVAAANSYSSNAATTTRRLLQVRVMAP